MTLAAIEQMASYVYLTDSLTKFGSVQADTRSPHSFSKSMGCHGMVSQIWACLQHETDPQPKMTTDLDVIFRAW